MVYTSQLFLPRFLPQPKKGPPKPIQTPAFLRRRLDAEDKFYIGMTCIIGLTISYTSIWAQSLISATQLKQHMPGRAGLGWGV